MLKGILNSIFRVSKVQEFHAFDSLALTGKPNQALLLPPSWDRRGAEAENIPIIDAPLLDLPPADVLRQALSYFESSTDAEILSSTPDGLKAVVCARTPLMRYPDLIYLEAVQIKGDQTKSSLAAYSHSLYGYSDLGANRKRLSGLCAHLRA